MYFVCAVSTVMLGDIGATISSATSSAESCATPFSLL